MKSLKYIVLCIMCLIMCMPSAFASGNPETVHEALQEKIVMLLGKPDLTRLDGWKFHSEVEFIITSHNQVLVLAVYTNNAFLDEYIKEKLNYTKINLKGVHRLTPYRIAVNFQKG